MRAPVHPTVADVTERIRSRNPARRTDYLARMQAAASDGPRRRHLACSNLAHSFAASSCADKETLQASKQPNVAIVSAYNDMLSAHQPLLRYPEQIKLALREAGGVGQFAGGVPAMCDGITQGEPGMELSLFSRDVIAMSTAIALSHDVFDAGICLGVCDKIVPGLLIGALSFGHLPFVFMPAGPMPSGLPNREKQRIRQQHAAGEINDRALLAAEADAYHAPGTCTFFGTANSNQMFMELLGLHLPGASFEAPNTPLRRALTVAGAQRAMAITRGNGSYTPIAEVVGIRGLVNAIVGLLATGGSTNHTIHLVAIARAAGIDISWQDFHDLSGAVPLLARIYPNGQGDVNHFHQAGGMAFLITQLLRGGLLHPKTRTIAGCDGLDAYTREVTLIDGTPSWVRTPATSRDPEVLRPIDDPFQSTGGLRLLDGNLGRAVIKVSALDPALRRIEAPARVFSDQHALLDAFHRDELNHDAVLVVRFQGPRANGMPELHKLMAPLGVLLDRGHRVALVTDGRLSGASGKVPAAIHVTPEAATGGPLALVRDGDLLGVDAEAGTLDVLAEETWRDRPPTTHDPRSSSSGVGRDLFAGFRAGVTPADHGATHFRIDR